MNIKSIFKQATTFTPYPYQERLATAETFPQVLSVPTGVGKTAAAVLSWVYRRRYTDDKIRAETPRRLVYCLPMRTLVEQTQTVAQEWVKKLDIDNIEDNGIGVHLLMGGADDGKWYEHPERDAILIGTQDMLLSRALNRGYGMSRYAWPIQYSLLNNDCLWVLDETQLMRVGLTTSAQLAGFRKKLQTYGNCQTLWMSATLNASAIETIDHPKPESGEWLTETIQEDDRAKEEVSQLLTASKPCSPASLSLTPDTKKTYEKLLAKLIHESHRPSTLTLVVLNRVLRAQSTFSELQKLIKNDKSDIDLKLIHSRFRPVERQLVQEVALDDKKIPAEGRILIATQAIEAGVDLSSTALITELAPWSSLVQRFGRCNRRGKCGIDGADPAQVLWVDIDTTDKKKAVEPCLPYSVAELDRAREAIRSCDDVGPSSLSEINVEEPPALVHVIRRKDLLDLFDTTPDLSGNDLDVSRYIRDSEETDVQVYWRDWKPESSKKTPPVPHNTKFPSAVRRELCSVPVGQFRAFHKKVQGKDKTKHLCWEWNALDNEWNECNTNSIRPGQTVLMHVSAGGYDAELGWTAEIKHTPGEAFPPKEGDFNSAMDWDNQGDQPLTIKEHLKDVGTAAEELRDSLTGNWETDVRWDEVIRAAWWHDVGKAHPAFQGAMRNAGAELSISELWAKSGGKGYLVYQIPIDNEDEKPQKRPGFRHELASALAWLQQHAGEEHADLIAYLIAAHHGKVRLSIRSMPNEEKSSEADQLFARGIWQGDQLPQVEVGNSEGDLSEEIKLDLNLMQLGEYEDQHGQTHPSWLTRMLQLRDTYGPFKLAYLETLVRVADWRGSKKGRNS
ncbi:CRISPR-associated helicase Cas3' [bacterium]|nr:CRISPR-associated helicase Cas3' [bacterium]